MSVSITVPSVTLSKSKTLGSTIISSTTTPALTAGTKTNAFASPTLDTKTYSLIGKKFPVAFNVISAGNDVDADFQIQFSLDGLNWTEVQSKAESVITFTDLPAVDGTVTLSDSGGTTLVYTAKASEDLGARQFNVTGTAATCTITFSGIPGSTGTITLISEDGTSITYNAAAASNFAANDFQADVSNTGAAAQLKLAIENVSGHNGKITVTDDGAGVLTCVQATKGSDGNTTVTETLANTTATSFTGGEFASAATSLKACIDAVAGHNGTIDVQDNLAGVLTLTQGDTGSTGNTAVTDNLTNATMTNFVGGTGSTAGEIISEDIKPNVLGVKLFIADLTDHVGIPYVRFLMNTKELELGTSFTGQWQFSFE